MPKLPHVSGTTVVKALEQLGFAKIRQSGNHIISGVAQKAASFQCTAKSSLEPLQVFCAKPTYRQTYSSRRCDLDV